MKGKSSCHVGSPGFREGYERIWDKKKCNCGKNGSCENDKCCENVKKEEEKDGK